MVSYSTGYLAAGEVFCKQVCLLLPSVFDSETSLQEISQPSGLPGSPLTPAHWRMLSGGLGRETQQQDDGFWEALEGMKESQLTRGSLIPPTHLLQEGPLHISHSIQVSAELTGTLGAIRILIFIPLPNCSLPRAFSSCQEMIMFLAQSQIPPAPWLIFLQILQQKQLAGKPAPHLNGT